MTDYTKPLTDQVENGAELEAAAHILAQTRIGVSGFIEWRQWVVHFPDNALNFVAEIRRQLAIIDGDASANARNAALEEAAQACRKFETIPLWPVIDAIRALKTEPGK